MVALRQPGKGCGISWQQTCLAPIAWLWKPGDWRVRSGFGLALQIGFLHRDKHGRNSLVWDAIEPLRASINARVFAFIASREFARSDFPAGGVSTYRIAQPIIAELLQRCLSPDQDVLECAAWMRELIMRYGAPSAREALTSGGSHISTTLADF
jgi:hypothetical protein